MSLLYYSMSEGISCSHDSENKGQCKIRESQRTFKNELNHFFGGLFFFSSFFLPTALKDSTFLSVEWVGI